MKDTRVVQVPENWEKGETGKRVVARGEDGGKKSTLLHF